MSRHRYLSVLALLILTGAFVSALNPAFLSLVNVRDLLVQAAPVIIIGCAMTFVVLTGEIDISVGSLYGLLAVLMGFLSSPSHAGLSVPLVVVITLAAGAGIGLLNGVLVTFARVPSIIATLGMLTILRDVAKIAMQGEQITDLPPGLRYLGTGSILSVPICIWVAAAVAIGALVVSRRTRLGLYFYGVGGNQEAAAHARISTRLVKIAAFGFSGLATAIATLVAVPQLSVIEPGLGAQLEIVVVTAVLVGGTSISGGLGGVSGTVIAAILLCSIRTALVFLKLGDMVTYWERAIQGVFILGAVLSDHVIRSGARRRRLGGRP